MAMPNGPPILKSSSEDARLTPFHPLISGGEPKEIWTYALCRFSNFGAIGIQIGGIGPQTPCRRGELAERGLRAMFGGMLACCMTACMAGIMHGV